MNKYLVRNFKWIENLNLGKMPAKVYRLGKDPESKKQTKSSENSCLEDTKITRKRERC